MFWLTTIITIAARDITKLLRSKGRIAANLIFPLLFIGVLGTSLQKNIGGSLSYNFIEFVFMGVLAQTLFQSTAAGIISLVEDRQNDFAQEMFVAPVPRFIILVGKIVGEMMIAMIQGGGILLFALLFGIPLQLDTLLGLLPFTLLIAFFGGTFGVLVMSNLNDQRAASSVFPFLLFPQFFLAGVFNPITVLPLPILIASRIAPMTYAVDLLRSIYFVGKPGYEDVNLFDPMLSIAVISISSIVFLSVGTWLFIRNETKK